VREKEYIMTQVAVIHTAFEETPRTVAFVEVGNINVLGEKEALEYAYLKTNNIEGSWSMGPTINYDGQEYDNTDWSDDVTVMAALPISNITKQPMGLRSTSTGDQLLIGNKKFKIAMCGFEEIL
tara:strand:+ start:567 stop:938 length:372 start_codon:yes stop_codon:yes gene_type:complete